MTVQTRIEPIKKSLEVSCDAATAFRFYTENIGDWWPKSTHSVGQARTKMVTMETRAGGRLYETLDDGEEKLWGTILVWDPPRQVVHSWHLSRDPQHATEVALRFIEIGDGRTRIELEHRNWENWGEDGAKSREMYNGGWDTVLGECFGGFVQRKAA